MPETRALPEPWWSTPNIHLCSLADFAALTEDLDLRVEHCAALVRGRPARPISPGEGLENWRAENALFLLSRRRGAEAEPEPTGAPRDLFGA
jgi:hypothetical protein